MRTIRILPGWFGSFLEPPGIERVTAVLSLWYDRYTQRRVLEDLPPHMLRDIGITETDRFKEVRKPFWMV